jgi:hypothetical protein
MGYTSLTLRLHVGEATSEDLLKPGRTHDEQAQDPRRARALLTARLSGCVARRGPENARRRHADPNVVARARAGVIDEVGITGAVLSVSSPHLNFVGPARAAQLARAINDYSADIKRRDPDRFGAYAILPLPDIAASVAELDHADELVVNPRAAKRLLRRQDE